MQSHYSKTSCQICQNQAKIKAEAKESQATQGYGRTASESRDSYVDSSLGQAPAGLLRGEID